MMILDKLGRTPNVKAQYDAVQTAGTPKDNNAAGWPVFSNRVPVQHGINLLSVSVEAWVAVALIANKSRCALLGCLAPFLADIAYFVAVDVPALGGPPSEAQTFIVSVGTLSAAMMVKAEHSGMPAWEFYLGVVGPIIFLVIAFVRAVGKLAGFWPEALSKIDKAVGGDGL